ncbi:LPXTG cell wall anchor domain-containing protein [Lacticaseibacillus daqingensis]|uniref:LPXTG cell wall anchor domain-containing protein n=1 Tax=Lacticaseibacillus daqingensis TaxID=2486014 RepID=UPI000F784FD0|nr:LPXTG cell wall anchor domain-containing protein [Lacticaseibacillus daqingensis]
MFRFKTLAVAALAVGLFGVAAGPGVVHAAPVTTTPQLAPGLDVTNIHLAITDAEGVSQSAMPKVVSGRTYQGTATLNYSGAGAELPLSALQLTSNNPAVTLETGGGTALTPGAGNGQISLPFTITVVGAVGPNPVVVSIGIQRTDGGRLGKTSQGQSFMIVAATPNEGGDDGNTPDTPEGSGDGEDTGRTDGDEDENMPETPDGSDNGNTPETPDGSDNGNTPETPDGSDNGNTPETPDGSDNENTPETPDGSDSGNTPETPDGSDNGNTPAVPDGSDNEGTPADAVTPSVPVVPSIPGRVPDQMTAQPTEQPQLPGHQATQALPQTGAQTHPLWVVSGLLLVLVSSWELVGYRRTRELRS